MSLLLIPASVGPATDPVLTPEYISVCAEDNGAGGTLSLNMGGVNDPTVAGAKDLSTFFGKNINELSISRAFRSIYSSAVGIGLTSQAAVQIRNNLAVTIYPIGAANSILGVNYDGLVVSGVRVPFLIFTGIGTGEGPTGIWRIDLQLRHSITD
jgi:hypothetical protein